MRLSDKHNIFLDRLMSEDFFLVRKYGYQCISTNVNDASGEILIVFINTTIEREVEVCFTPLNARNEEHDLISLNIFRDSNNFFNLQDYLRHMNIDDFSKVSGNTADEYYKELRKNNPFYLVNIEGNFDNRLMHFISYIEKLSDKYFRKILEGKEWEEIPFDWGPYK